MGVVVFSINICKSAIRVTVLSLYVQVTYSKMNSLKLKNSDEGYYKIFIVKNGENRYLTRDGNQVWCFNIDCEGTTINNAITLKTLFPMTLKVLSNEFIFTFKRIEPMVYEVVNWRNEQLVYDESDSEFKLVPKQMAKAYNYKLNIKQVYRNKAGGFEDEPIKSTASDLDMFMLVFDSLIEGTKKAIVSNDAISYPDKLKCDDIVTSLSKLFEHFKDIVTNIKAPQTKVATEAVSNAQDENKPNDERTEVRVENSTEKIHAEKTQDENATDENATDTEIQDEGDEIQDEGDVEIQDESGDEIQDAGGNEIQDENATNENATDAEIQDEVYDDQDDGDDEIQDGANVQAANATRVQEGAEVEDSEDELEDFYNGVVVSCNII